MGMLNQWKIIDLEVEAQTAFKRGDYDRCRALVQDGIKRLEKENHSSFPSNWEYHEKFSILSRKLYTKTGRGA